MLEFLRSEFLNNHNTTKADAGPAHEFLNAFLGTWKVEGHNADSNDRVHGTEIYSWLEGNYFLINKWNRPSSEGPFSGLGWILYDAENEKYRSYSVSNNGYFRVYDIEVKNNIIQYHGEQERGTVEVSTDRNALRIHWEFKVGPEWKLLCQLDGQRLQS